MATLNLTLVAQDGKIGNIL